MKKRLSYHLILFFILLSFNCSDDFFHSINNNEDNNNITTTTLYNIDNILEDENQPNIEEWTWLKEDFTIDFIKTDNNPNDWFFESKTNLSIENSSDIVRIDSYDSNYLRGIAKSDDVSIFKKSNIRGGALDKFRVELFFNLQSFIEYSKNEYSISTFRNNNHETVASIRIVNQSGDSYRLHIRYYSANSSDYITLKKDNWYKFVFNYDLSFEKNIKLLCCDNSNNSLGVIEVDSKDEKINDYLFGKTSYEQCEGVFLFDDISIIVPALAHRWVSMDGNDLSSGLTSIEPLKTIQKAVDSSGPGTIIHIKSGNYNEKILFSYQGTNPTKSIIIMRGEGANPGDVIIDGTNINISWSGLVDIFNTGFIKIRNLTIKNSEYAGLFLNNSNNIIIENIKTEYTGLSGVYVAESEYIDINKVDIFRGCVISPDIMLAQENISMKSVSNFVISNSKVHGGPGQPNGGEGICVKGYSKNGIIKNNFVCDLPKDVGIYLGVGSPSTDYSTHNILVYNNNVSTDVGIAVSSELGGVVEDLDIFNNIVYDGLYGGILVTKWLESGTGDAIGMRKNIRIFNNTVYNQGSGGVGGGIEIQCDDPTKIDDIKIINNICYENKTADFIIPDSVKEKVIMSHCLYNGTIITPADFCLNCYKDNPSFINTGINPLDINANSPAIDKGIAIMIDLDFDGVYEDLSFDYLGRNRSINSIDIGAYEN